MNKKFILLLGIFLYLTLNLTASSRNSNQISREKRILIEKLLEVSGVHSQVNNTHENLKQMLLLQFGNIPGSSFEKKKKLKRQMLEKFEKTFNWKNMKKDYVIFYAKNFTKSELKYISDFYSTPTGEKYKLISPTLQKESMYLIQKSAKKSMDSVQNFVDTFLKNNNMNQEIYK